MDTCLHRIGRDYFLKNEEVQLPPEIARQIRVLPGFSTDVTFKKLNGEPRLLLNVDTKSKVISQQSVLQEMVECKGNAKGYTAEAKQEIRRRLVGTVVFTT